jgi:hypothetical protein
MLYISNRGNLAGPDLANENSVAYVNATLARGYHVAVDAWLVKNQDGSFQPALGELQPQYPVNIEFLQNPKLIARVKDITTFQILTDSKVHCVLANTGNTLTSAGLIWTPKGSRIVTRSSVLNMPEWFTNNMKDLAPIKCAGICSNFIESISLTREALLKAEAEKKEALLKAEAEKKEASKLNTIPEEPDIKEDIVTDSVKLNL